MDEWTYYKRWLWPNDIASDRVYRRNQGGYAERWDKVWGEWVLVDPDYLDRQVYLGGLDIDVISEAEAHRRIDEGLC